MIAVARCLGFAFAVGCLGRLLAADTVRSWVTSEDLTHRLTAQPEVTLSASPTPAGTVITVDPTKTFQTIYGLGASLEHTTCSNLFRMAPAERERAMDLLVSPDRGLGMNLMRVCIGTSDFAGEPWYSYSDLPAGQTDPELKGFSIAKDQAYILPCLKLAKARNPELIFFASPWSPPGWMKTTGNMIGGELKREWYPAYAQYFVKFIRAYATEGIEIAAVTVQNEPGVDRAKEKDPKWFYPSCHWTGEQERDFIRDHLGPAFRRAGLKTKIWCYDHNYNAVTKDDSAGLPHPRTILSDPAAAAFVDGVGFHHYEGKPDGMTQFHAEFPTKPIHFTEGSVFSIWGGYDLVERLRNWATSYNAWVAILDEKGRPNNGPFPATKAILRYNSETGRVEEIFEYYNYGHFMKFIRRGAVRIESSPSTQDLSHVAFLNPNGELVLVLANTTGLAKPIVVSTGARHFLATVPGKSVVTCVWRP
jgi:O-glycosyl hydrolase